MFRYLIENWKIITLAVLLVLLVVQNVGFVSEQTVYIIEQFGKYLTTWNAGLHVKIPVIQRVARTLSLKEQCADYPSQSVITKDNVMLESNSVVFFRIVDPKLATYGVEDNEEALMNLSATILRNIFGEMDLDECLNSREKINAKMLSVLNEVATPWGIKITRVEIKDITPPSGMVKAMKKQSIAEREKRVTILEAESEKESAILRAEGNKRSAVLNADAEKERTLRLAEAKAQAIKIVNDAHADAIRVMREASTEEAYLTIKKLETLNSVADGNATKLFIPTDLASTAGVLGSLVESVKDKK